MTNPTTCNLCHSSACPQAPANHPSYFPIDPASAHATVGCTQCHTDLGNPTVATNFACGTCHLARDSALVTKHTTTTSNTSIRVPASEMNTSDSSTCLRCHADSQVNLTSAHPTGQQGDPSHHSAACLTCHDLLRTDKVFGADFGTTGPLLAGCAVHGCANCHHGGCSGN
jgi:hypothetical protein